MVIKQWIGVVAMVLLACCHMGFAYQKAEVAAPKAQGRQGQLIPVTFVTAAELKAKISKKESLSIIDLRAEDSYLQSDQTIKGSLHTKVRKVAWRLREIPRDQEVITFCACPADEAATIAAQSLMANGFKRVRVLKGGWSAWVQAGGQLEPRPRL